MVKPMADYEELLDHDTACAIKLGILQDLPPGLIDHLTELFDCEYFVRSW
jgi:hypothetical protein